MRLAASCRFCACGGCPYVALGTSWGFATDAGGSAVVAVGVLQRDKLSTSFPFDNSSAAFPEFAWLR